jgi:acyl-CoA synthetase (NDP forming)
MGVVTASGGACDIIADRAHDEGIQIPEFSPETVATLSEVLPSFTSPQNPIDATGYGLAHQASAARPITSALEAVTRDPNVDFVLYLGVNLPAVQTPDPAPTEQRIEAQAAIMHASPVPVLAANTTCSDIGDFARGLLMPRRMSVLAGLDLSLTAIGHALRWQEHRSRPAPAQTDPVVTPTPRDWILARPPGVWSEVEGRRLLEEAGVPCVPAQLVHSADEAVRAAELFGLPVVLKAHAPGLAHKSDIGGVALNLSSESSVREACARIVAPTRNGALVAPMRSGGQELLAGVTVDPTFGPVLAVGLGGIWVELLHDVALRVLPITHADARAMLDELKAAPVLRGARGGTPADLDRLVEVLMHITDAAAMLGSTLRALEVNPLWCSGDQVEALDVLVVTGSEEEA